MQTARVSKEQFVEGLEQLKKAVYDLSELYDKDSSLNDRFSISDIVPKSLDEWHSSIAEKIQEIKDSADEIKDSTQA